MSKHVLKLFWGNFISKKSRQCTLEGRGLEKTLKKRKTSKLSKLSENVPKNIVWECFDWVFRRKTLCPVHTGDSKKIHKNRKDFKVPKSPKTFPKVSKLIWGIFFRNFLAQCNLEIEFCKNSKKKRKKIDFSKVSKTFLEVSKQVSNLFWGNFLGKNYPVHPGRSKLGKTSKNWKTFIFSKCPNTFPKVFKHVFNMPRGIFSGEKFRLVHPGGSRSRKKIQKNGNKSHFFKIPKNISKSVQICFELIFFELFLTSAPWRSKLAEIRKKIEKIEFLRVSKNVLKSFQTSVELVLRFFSGNKYCPVQPGGSKHGKTSEKRKNFHFFQNAQKRSPKSSNTFWTCFELVFSVKTNWPVHPWGSKLGKNRKKNRKNLKTRKCPKTFLKVSKQVLNLFWGDFFGKNCPVHPGESKLGKTPKNWKNLQFFKMPKKRSQKQSNMFWTCFEVIFSVKILHNAPWGVE